jgi:hypothetical protein
VRDLLTLLKPTKPNPNPNLVRDLLTLLKSTKPNPNPNLVRDRVLVSYP